MNETNAILNDVKKMLNIPEDVSEFDTDINAHINSVFFSLYQLGIEVNGNPFVINSSTSWSDLQTSVPKEVILDYLFLKVSMVFDSPTASSVSEAYKDRISELEFRINIYVDDGGGNVTG